MRRWRSSNCSTVPNLGKKQKRRKRWLSHTLIVSKEKGRIAPAFFHDAYARLGRKRQPGTNGCVELVIGGFAYAAESAVGFPCDATESADVRRFGDAAKRRLAYPAEGAVGFLCNATESAVRGATGEGFPKFLLIKAIRRPSGFREVRRVFLSAHPEIGEVMQEVAEHILAVLGVLHGVEDMAVPELVHVLARRDRFFGVLDGQRQKTPVRDLHLIDVFAGPALALFGVHQLEFDRFEVEGLNRRNDFFDGLAFRLHLHELLLFDG